ncbi:FixH family protein [Chondromyces crocatus]|nr:FixH family protein [Chondromyces crocatus]
MFGSVSRRGVMVLVAALMAFGSGCDGGDEDGATTTTTHGHEGVCEGETRGDHYSAGMEVPSTSGAHTLRLQQASPAPPVKGENTWTFVITDDTGAGVTGATVTVTPRMPDHGHGSPQPPTVSETGEAGEFQASAIDFSMAGYWEVTIAAALATGETESFVLGFCVEG